MHIKAASASRGTAVHAAAALRLHALATPIKQRQAVQCSAVTQNGNGSDVDRPPPPSFVSDLQDVKNQVSLSAWIPSPLPYRPFVCLPCSSQMSQLIQLMVAQQQQNSGLQSQVEQLGQQLVSLKQQVAVTEQPPRPQEAQPQMGDQPTAATNAAPFQAEVSQSAMEEEVNDEPTGHWSDPLPSPMTGSIHTAEGSASSDNEAPLMPGAVAPLVSMYDALSAAAAEAEEQELRASGDEAEGRRGA